MEVGCMEVWLLKNSPENLLKHNIPSYMLKHNILPKTSRSPRTKIIRPKIPFLLLLIDLIHISLFLVPWG